MRALVCVALVAACGSDKAPQKKEKTVDELKAVWGAKVQAKLEKVVAAAKAAEGAELGTPGDAQLALDFEGEEGKTLPNAIAVPSYDALSATAPAPEQAKKDSVAELAKVINEGGEIPTTIKIELPHPDFSFQHGGYTYVTKAKSLLGIPSPFASPETVYDTVVNAKYALFVTPVDVKWPEQEGLSFQSGVAKLRAVLVEIDTAKPLGGFEATATNSAEVKVESSPTGVNADFQKHKESVQRKLDNDFLRELGGAVVKGIETRWPGTKTSINLRM